MEPPKQLGLTYDELFDIAEGKLQSVLDEHYESGKEENSAFQALVSGMMSGILRAVEANNAKLLQQITDAEKGRE